VKGEVRAAFFVAILVTVAAVYLGAPRPTTPSSSAGNGGPIVAYLALTLLPDAPNSTGPSGVGCSTTVGNASCYALLIDGPTQASTAGVFSISEQTQSGRDGGNLSAVLTGNCSESWTVLPNGTSIPKDATCTTSLAVLYPSGLWAGCTISSCGGSAPSSRPSLPTPLESGMAFVVSLPAPLASGDEMVVVDAWGVSTFALA
jgi:hypothetical protein